MNGNANKPTSDLFVALVSGQADYHISPMASAMAHIKNSKMHALAAPEVRDAFSKISSQPLSSTSEELSKRMADGIEWFAQVAKLAGIKPQ